MRRPLRHPLVVVACAALLAPAATGLGATPGAATLSPRAPAVDHAPFDALLRAHVRDGLVDYDAFAAAPTFRAYLAQLAAADPAALDRAGQLALWINAYNAYTIQLIVAHRERRSIRNINRTLGFVKAYGPWRERMATVGGTRYTLDAIEQEILRGRFREPRIHFALVCAAMGCPPLRAEAYVPARLDAQLDDQARRFLVRTPEKNRVDVAANTAYLSPILVEFRDYIQDFGGTHDAVGRYVARWYPPGPERALLERGDFRVVVTPYDWTLNSQENGRRAATR